MVQFDIASFCNKVKHLNITVHQIGGQIIFAKKGTIEILLYHLSMIQHIQCFYSIHDA